MSPYDDPSVSAGEIADYLYSQSLDQMQPTLKPQTHCQACGEPLSQQGHYWSCKAAPQASPSPNTRRVTAPGKYLLTADLHMRGSNCCGTLPAGNTVIITQVNSLGNKCISPSFLDWMHCYLPLIPYPEAPEA